MALAEAAFGQAMDSTPWKTEISSPAAGGQPGGTTVTQAIRETRRAKAAPPARAETRETAHGPAVEPPAIEELARRYCAASTPTAERTKLEKDRREIETAAAELGKRIDALNEATAQHKEWLAKRNAFQAQVQEALVRIYSRMKPEAAAAQVGEMEPLAAAAVLSRMEPKAAGAILAEIEPVRAGRIATLFAVAAELDQVAPTAPSREAKK